MKPSDKEIADPEVARDLFRPLRWRVFCALKDRKASPSKLSRYLGAPLRDISFHVRELCLLGMVKLAQRTSPQGSIERQYVAAAQAVISDESWAQFPDDIKRCIHDSWLEQIGKDLRKASFTDGFHRAEIQLCRIPLTIDPEAWNELSHASVEYRKRLLQIERDAIKRLKRKDQKQEKALVLLAAFEDNSRSDQASFPHWEDRRVEDS